MDTSKQVEITPDIIDKLDREIARTGMSPRIFYMHICKNPPEGLKAHTIENWLAGRTSYTEKVLLDYVLGLYESSPNEAYEIALTRERLEFLKAELLRTGRSPAQIIRIIGNHVPKGLTAELVSKWLTGKRKKAKRAQWDCIMDAYAKF